MAATPRKRTVRSDSASSGATARAVGRKRSSSETGKSTPAKKSARKSTASSRDVAAGGTGGAGGRSTGPQPGDGAGSPRQRLRAETLERILTIAHDQLIAQGADALSLRSVARELGMVSSAVYRYVDSREDLMRRLAARAGSQLSDAVEAALRNRRGDPARRFPVLARAVHAWATEHPADFALLYGRIAPQGSGAGDTGGLGLPGTLLRLFAEDGASGGGRFSAAARRELAALGTALGVDAQPEVAVRALLAWSGIVGAVALELSGQLTSIGDNPGALFDVQVDRIAAATGLTS